MRRTEMLQEIRKMRFEEVYGGWNESRLTQEAAARILGVCIGPFVVTLIATSREAWRGYRTGD